MKKATDLIKWYWDIGHRRTGEERLSTSQWLDQLYSVYEQSQRIATASAASRGALALWGASQAGKSTLLARYIDAGGRQSGGQGSALDWGKPALFSDAGLQVDKSVVVFNPFNFKTDGSACITRFVLGSPTDPDINPQYPVRVRLFQPRQLLHALAAGFLSECQPEDENRQVTHWDAQRVKQLLGQNTANNPVPNRPAYELLRDVVEVLRLLCHTKAERYRNLATNFDDLRKSILESARLLTSHDNVIQFAARLFWNNWTNLTAVFTELCRCRETLTRRSGRPAEDLSIFCSMGVARLLVDFLSYSALTTNNATAPLIRSLRWKPKGSAILITDDPAEGGEPLFTADKDFALIQALVRELVVPLREDVLAKHSPLLHQVLNRADILDIPGTAREFEAADTELLTNEAIGGPKESETFTQILKRGKTSSLVLSSARNLDIDGFTIMAKWGDFIGQQKQLDNGVDAWWQSLTDSPLMHAATKELPLNFVVTFFGGLVNEILGGADAGKVGAAFRSFFGKLGPIRDPRVCSTFATTYKQIRDGGKIEHPAHPGEPPPAEDLERIYAALQGREDFRSQFLDGNWSDTGEPASRALRDAFFEPDGGTDYLLRKLLNDASNPIRRQKVALRLESVRKEWAQLVKQALPPAERDAQMVKQQLINEWSARLESRLDELHRAEPAKDSSQRLSYWMRTFLHVDASHLSSANLHRVASQQAFDYELELRQQLERWKSRSPTMPLEEVGIADEPQAMRLRWFLAEKVLEDDLAEYDERLASPFTTSETTAGFCSTLHHTLGTLERQAMDNALPFLAIGLSRAVAGLDYRQVEIAPNVYGVEHERLPHPEVSMDTLDTLSREVQVRPRRHFDYRTSPHYRTVIMPFLLFLTEVAKLPASRRPDQPGDEELRRLNLESDL